MIICPKCRNQLADGTKFCKFCGQPLSRNPAPSSWEEKAPAQNIQVTPPAPKKKKTPKGIIIAIIAVLLVALIVLGIIFIPDLLDKKKDEEDLTNKEKLTQLLEESTTKPIVEFVYDDYDSDGTYEAYAVVGETDEEDEKHPEFYDADIYFVNQKKAQPIKENISGKSNGKIHLDEITYISIEVYEDGTDEGKSFIYTADGTKSEEADISGEYSNVHEENGKVIGFDENGNEVEVDLSGKKNNSPQEVNFWDEIPSDFTFSSGAGGWGTFLTINSDGTFEGSYHDSNMGDTGEGYPYGTVYICNFSGKFTNPVKIDDYTYSTSIESITLEKNPGETYYENETRYITSDPYGLDNAEEIYFYLPGKPISEIPEDFLSWAHLNTDYIDKLPMDFCGLYNVNGFEGFVGYKENSIWSKDYEYSYNGHNTKLWLNCDYYSQLVFWDEENSTSVLTISFMIENTDTATYTAYDEYYDEYDVTLQFNEDLSAVDIKIDSHGTADLSLWGGSSDGVLEATYSLVVTDSYY